MSRFFVTASLAAVSLLVVQGAGGSLGTDAASPRVASPGSVPAASQGRLDARALCRRRSCASPRRSADPAARSVAAPPPARTPAPIARRGYRVVFADPFTKLRRRVWDSHEWWNTRPPRRSQYVRHGIFHLVSRRSQGYENITATTFSSRKIFRYGYFEARMKWTRGNGAWPVFWLMSNAWARAGPNVCSTAVRAAEIDVIEAYGNHPRVFTGTIHRNSAEFVCPSPPNAINDNNWQPRNINLTARFHTYALRWTPTRVTWYIDQRRIMSWPVFSTTNTRMFLLLSMQIGGESDPDSSTPDALHTQVDWVRVWQKR